MTVKTVCKMTTSSEPLKNEEEDEQENKQVDCENVTSTTKTKNNPLKKNIRNLRIEVLPHLTRELSDLNVNCANYYSTDNNIEDRNPVGNSPSTVKSVDDDSTYGTHYPNRIFVGHLPGKASATDLANFFYPYGTVLEGKIVLDTFGRSRRFGFVTFSTHEDVENVLSKKDLYLKGKKINVGPAVKKMFAPEFSPPSTPLEFAASDGSDKSDEMLGEKIVTVPPVNEKKDSVGSPIAKQTNVWQKVNIKRKPSSKPQTPRTPASPAVIYPAQTFNFQQPQLNGNVPAIRYTQPIMYPFYTLPYEKTYPVYQYINGEETNYPAQPQHHQPQHHQPQHHQPQHHQPQQMQFIPQEQQQQQTTPPQPPIPLQQQAVYTQTQPQPPMLPLSPQPIYSQQQPPLYPQQQLIPQPHQQPPVIAYQPVPNGTMYFSNRGPVGVI